MGSGVIADIGVVILSDVAIISSGTVILIIAKSYDEIRLQIGFYQLRNGELV